MTYSGYRQVKWGDISVLEYGRALRDYHEHTMGVPVYGTNGQIGYTDTALGEGPTVIVGRKGAYRGVHFCEGPFFVIDTAFYLRLTDRDVDMKWAFYALRNVDINSMGSGSAIPSTSRTDFYNLPVNIPPLSIQRDIVKILSSLDDKIELNRRMNETLEQMAMALYEHWFIDFGPFQDGEFVESELGLIPKGWEVGTLDDAYFTGSGGTPSRSCSEYYGGCINWLKTKELSDGFIFDTEEKITELGLSNSSAKLFSQNTVVMAMYGATVGQLGVLATDSATNQACCAMWPKSYLPYEYLYLYLKTNRDFIISLANGGAQQNISQQVIKRLQMILPPPDVIKATQDGFSNMFALIRENERSTQTLQQTRDYLLPRLLSGDIELREAQEQVEEVV